MKRTPLKAKKGFKKPTYAEALEKKKAKSVKKVVKKKVKKLTIKQLQDKIWIECRRIADIRHKNTCYTCGKQNLFGSDKQLGHMIPKSTLGAYMKYDLRILRWQCTNCNIWGGGMGYDFYKNMRKEVGDLAMEQIEKDRQVDVKAYDFYLQLLEEYKKIEK